MLENHGADLLNRIPKCWHPNNQHGRELRLILVHSARDIGNQENLLLHDFTVVKYKQEK